MKLELKKFNLTSITDDKVVVMIGKRNTGKSFLIKDLLYYNKNIPLGTVISGTESANHFFSEIVPKMFIHEEYTAQIIDNVVKRQHMVMKRINKENDVYGQSHIDPRSFLILDDCLYDSTWTKDKNVRAVFCRNANGWVTIPKSIKLPNNQQDRDMIARELLVKFQMSKKHPLVDLKKAYLKF